MNPNPRRASFRYRCLYPMGALRRQSVDAAFLNEAERADGLVLVLDAWDLFPSVNPDGHGEMLIELAVDLGRRGARIVIDNCDNQFAGRGHSAQWDNALANLRHLLEIAHAATVCSGELANVMRKEYEHPLTIEVVDDPVEDRIVYPGDSLGKKIFGVRRHLSRLRLAGHAARIGMDKAGGRTCLVWFGSQGNQFSGGGMRDLTSIFPVLSRLNRTAKLSLTVISNSQKKFDELRSEADFPMHYLEWDRINFIQALALHDVAVLPAMLNEFTRCKSTNRVVMALSRGLAVVADPIPSYEVYREVIRLGDWERNLGMYLGARRTLDEDVRRGRALVQALNSLDVIAGQWARALGIDVHSRGTNTSMSVQP